MINCLAVDDEPLALDLLEDFAGKIQSIKLVRRCDNAVEAIEFLKKTKIDILFLDIHMPDISGFQLLKSVEQKPKLIFTTAYSEHAVKGFELDAVDYLLKPYSFERFKRAIDKAIKEIEAESRIETPAEAIFIKSGYETIKIPVADILYIEALKDYIQIYTGHKKILSLLSMRAILDLLPPGKFLRVHRSFIVPLNRISRFTNKDIYILETKIPIGDSFKEQFIAAMNRKKD